MHLFSLHPPHRTRHCDSIQYNHKLQHLKLVETNSLALKLKIDCNAKIIKTWIEFRK
jgi:hypothetical protein